VEATDQPMQGITLLKEALAADSTNVDALLNLGLFAERSQQYDKALERYRTILRLHPDYISMWLKMAEVYEQMGDKTNTIACLEQYLALETDPVMKNDMENYLARLKQ
jgi:lipopolysaccharide biosynthesis regulator YciM